MSCFKVFFTMILRVNMNITNTYNNIITNRVSIISTCKFPKTKEYQTHLKKLIKEISKDYSVFLDAFQEGVFTLIAIPTSGQLHESLLMMVSVQ